MLIIPDVNISHVLEDETEIGSPQPFEVQFPIEQKAGKITSNEYFDGSQNKTSILNSSHHIKKLHTTGENTDTVEHV